MKKVQFRIRRSPLDVRSNFQWHYTYNEVYKKKTEASDFLNLLADNFSADGHNIERHEDYFIDHTTQCKTEILVF